MSVDLVDTTSPAWKRVSQKWHARILQGTYAHCCPEHGGKPLDELQPEWPCACAAELTNGRVRKGDPP